MPRSVEGLVRRDLGQSNPQIGERDITNALVNELSTTQQNYGAQANMREKSRSSLNCKLLFDQQLAKADRRSKPRRRRSSLSDDR